MRQKIENHMLITCDDVDFTTLSNMELYMTQDAMFFQYEPVVKSAHELVVTVPVEDANRLKKTSVRIQLAFTDASGTPNASCIVSVPVLELLKESSYDPD